MDNEGSMMMRWKNFGDCHGAGGFHKFFGMIFANFAELYFIID